jgi:alkylation response protein AidB-like acyl-CoA dehydrogenase
MDLSFNAEERAFQDEVRGFIAKNLTEEMKRATALTPSVFSDPDIGMAWQRTLHKQGWGAPGWPVEHGGPDWTPAQRWWGSTHTISMTSPMAGGRYTQRCSVQRSQSLNICVGWSSYRSRAAASSRCR